MKKDLDQLITDRHSTRLFLSTPVPRPLVLEALALAQHAPSNSNIQPWRITFVAGPALERLKDALLAVAKAGTPNIPPLPATFGHYRKELGMQLYGVSMGIAHEHEEGRAAAVLRNFEFFGAPLAAIISMPQDLGPPDALSVGLWLQTLLLALTERGLVWRSRSQDTRTSFARNCASRLISWFFAASLSATLTIPSCQSFTRRSQSNRAQR